MDKASIVGDSVLYVQDLQKQAKKLKAEIASLEASLAGADDRDRHLEGSTKPNKDSNNDQFVSKGILQVRVMLFVPRLLIILLTTSLLKTDSPMYVGPTCIREVVNNMVQ